jgi:HSP20 family molecular chaperone IbpA
MSNPEGIEERRRGRAVARCGAKDFLSSFFDNDFFKTSNSLFDDDVYYSTNDEGQSVLKIDVPGFNKDNLKVEVSKSILTVQGETDTRKVFKQYKLNNIENVTATIKDGVLTLTLLKPKKEEPTKIEITS